MVEHGQTDGGARVNSDLSLRPTLDPRRRVLAVCSGLTSSCGTSGNPGPYAYNIAWRTSATSGVLQPTGKEPSHARYRGWRMRRKRFIRCVAAAMTRAGLCIADFCHKLGLEASRIVCQALYGRPGPVATRCLEIE